MASVLLAMSEGDEVTRSLESDSAGVAAASVVAAAIDGLEDGIPPELLSFLDEHRTELRKLREAATRLVRSVRTSGELKDLWAEEGDLSWVGELDALLERLGEDVPHQESWTPSA